MSKQLGGHISTWTLKKKVMKCRLREVGTVSQLVFGISIFEKHCERKQNYEENMTFDSCCFFLLK